VKPGQAAVARQGSVKNPNGIALSPDEQTLYVIDANYNDSVEGYALEHEQSLWKYSVLPDGSLDPNGELFLPCPVTAPLSRMASPWMT
jgi:sugar lactone lactonase YvrE